MNILMIVVAYLICGLITATCFMISRGRYKQRMKYYYDYANSKKPIDVEDFDSDDEFAAILFFLFWPFVVLMFILAGIVVLWEKGLIIPIVNYKKNKKEKTDENR